MYTIFLRVVPRSVNDTSDFRHQSTILDRIFEILRGTDCPDIHPGKGRDKLPALCVFPSKPYNDKRLLSRNVRGSEEGSYLRLIDFCITQLLA